MPLALNWTKMADNQLLELRAAGLPWHAVADRLRVGRNAAIERARRLGLQPLTRMQPAPRPSAERVDRPPLPPGHPLSWQAITVNTTLDGEAYPYPVFI
jgi:hypothetical protein